MKNLNRRPIRRVAFGLAALAAVTVGAGVATSNASPDQSSDQKAVIARLDAEARERDAKSSTLPVVDQKTGNLVDVSKADLAAEQRRAAEEPGYLDANGNPRYMLLWSDGRLVPGPALDCHPNPIKGEADICTLKE